APSTHAPRRARRSLEANDRGDRSVLSRSLVRRSVREFPARRIGYALLPLWALWGALAVQAAAAATFEPTPARGPVEWQVVNQWNTGYQAEVRVSNHSRRTVSGWNLEFDLAGEIQGSWNASLASANTTRSATGLDWNATIPPGGSVSFGFIGAYQG